MAPPYRPPAVPAVATFKEAGPWQVAAPADTAAHQPWWTVFRDAELARLEQKLDSDNPTLAGALGRYDQARAYLAEARGGLLPTVGVNTDVSRNRQSDNRPLRGANQPDFYPADTIGGTVSYDLDLWGRIRDSVAAGKAEAEASADDLAASKLSLEAQLATSYILLRGYDRQRALLSAAVDAYGEADAVTQRRFRGGIASGLDIGRSGTQLAEAQAQLADVNAARALTEHAIASLIGTPASTFSLPASNAPITVPAIPPLVASTLLERRPDVAAAERRMAAANALIGVARAAFFPNLSLRAQGGFENTGLADLLTAPNFFWSIGPSAVLQLFDGGKRRARVAIARAAWSQATADYRAHVLQAFQDVEDNLARLHFYRIEAEAEQRAVEQASQTERLAMNRYVKGAVSYLDVVTAQTSALQARRRALNLETLRLQAGVNLIRALGGGWSVHPAIEARSARGSDATLEGS